MTINTYACPYCWGEVPEPATVCMHCSKELTLFRPLAIQLNQLRAEVVQLQSQVKLQAQQFDDLVQAVKLHSGQTDAGINQETASINEVADQPQALFWSLLNQVLMALLVIGLSHWLLLFVYDAPPLILRIWTILWPALPGFMLAKQIRRGWFIHLLTSVFVGLSSVAIMLQITAQIDQVPFLPANARDWKETFEYAAAISLSFFTGYLILKQRQRLKTFKDSRISLSVFLEKDKNGEFQIAEISKQVNSLITNFAPIVSTATAMYTGLKAFTGG